MAEAFDNVQSPPANKSNEGFIQIKSVGRFSFARELRLRDGDVIVAIDGLRSESDIIKLENQLDDIDEPILVTLFRDGHFLPIFVSKKLDCPLEYAPSEVSEAVALKLEGHEFDKPQNYRSYEALRDVRRNVFLYEADNSKFATYFPALWLLNNRMWEPLFAVLASYAVCFLIHPLVFIPVYLLVSVYFDRAQVNLIRGYGLFTEHYFWLIMAARTDEEAMTICRQFDRKCQFRFGSAHGKGVEEQPKEPGEEEASAV